MRGVSIWQAQGHKGRDTMEFTYCPNCKKMEGYKRALGWIGDTEEEE